jgi:hypothetical protein
LGSPKLSFDGGSKDSCMKTAKTVSMSFIGGRGGIPDISLQIVEGL